MIIRRLLRPARNVADLHDETPNFRLVDNEWARAVDVWMILDAGYVPRFFAAVVDAESGKRCSNNGRSSVRWIRTER